MTENENNALRTEEEQCAEERQAENELNAQSAEASAAAEARATLPVYTLTYAAPPSSGIASVPSQGNGMLPPLTSDKITPLIFETPEGLHIKGLKGVVTAVSAAFTSVWFLMLAWSFVFIGIARALGMSNEGIVALSGNFYFINTIQIVLSTLLFTAPFIIVARCRRVRVSDIAPLGRPIKGTALPYFGIGLAICSVSNVMTNDLDTLFGKIFENSNISYEVSSSPTESGISAFILTLLASAVVPALVEEFGCRGIALGMLRGWGDETAIIISSVLFGLVHANFLQIPFAFLAGIGFAVVRLKTGTLWVACAVHFCNNLISVLLSGPLAGLSPYIRYTVYWVYLALSMLLGIIGVLMLRKNKIKSEALKADTFGFKTGFLVKTALGTPMLIVFAVLCLISSLFYIVI